MFHAFSVEAVSRAPICRDCSGRGTRYYDTPAREICRTCEGTGQREPKAIEVIGPRKRSKMLQVSEHKMNYVNMVSEARGMKYFINGDPTAPCQACGDDLTINHADFSHKRAAGMGGAGDRGGLVEASNGTYSCRCCHAFMEQDQEARDEHQLSPATIENGLQVEYSEPVRSRLDAWRRRWYNLPEEMKRGSN